MIIYGKISHSDGFSKWGKLIWEFFMGNCTILITFWIINGEKFIDETGPGCV
jgi:hypothetical protein